MSAALDTAKFVWEILKDGGKSELAGKTVDVLPRGMTKDDVGGWLGPVSFDERYEELSAIFQSELAEFRLTTEWEYNGQYIANFNVVADGTVDVLSSVTVTVTTLEAHMNDDDIAELPYRIEVVFHNVIGGTRRTTFKAKALGDGSGMSQV